MLKKKMLAVLLCCIMVFSLVACGGGDKGNDNKKDETKEDSKQENVIESQNKDVPEGQMITFEDGAFAFAAINSAKGGSDASELSVEEFNGSKALKVTTSDNAGTHPYVAFDLDAILGDNIEKVAKVQMDVAVQGKDGSFKAVSGTLYAYTGEDLAETTGTWSVYMETQNPKIQEIAVSGLVKGKGNMLQLSKDEDNNQTSDIYIDNIVFRDSSDQPIDVITTGEFVGPSDTMVFASPRDWSNLQEVVNEREVFVSIVDQEGYTKPDGTASGTDVAFLCTGKQNGNEMDYNNDFTLYNFDADHPYITVYYESENAPVLIVESNKDDAPQKKAEVEASAVNGSNNICQYKLEDVAAAFGTDDMTSYLDVLSLRANGSDIKITGITIGSARTIDDSKAIEYNYKIDTVSGPNCLEIPLSEVGESTGGKPFSKIIIQISGQINNGDYMGVIDTDGSFGGGQTAFAMTIPGYNENDWFYSDKKPSLSEPDPNGFYEQLIIGDGYRGVQEITYEIPKDVQDKMDFTADGIMQLGVWYTASSTCVIDKIQYITE